MRARRRLLALIAVIGGVAVMSAGASAAPAHWGAAIEVPGTTALNLHGSAAVASISCPSPGTCTAGGYYNHRWADVEYYGLLDSNNQEKYGKAFVANETNGDWGTGVTVPTHGRTSLNPISCPMAGSCAAGGSYTDRHGRRQAWV